MPLRYGGASSERHLAYAKTLEDALALVVGNHLQSHTPIVHEGDFILPSLALRETYGEEPANGQVRALFLYEEDEAQIAQNFRERHGSDQSRRTRTSWCVNQWLRGEPSGLACRPLRRGPGRLRFSVPSQPSIGQVDDVEDRAGADLVELYTVSRSSQDQKERPHGCW